MKSWSNIKNATVLSIAKKSIAGYLISYYLKDSYKKLCNKYNIPYKFSEIPNHDAMIYVDQDGGKYVAESISPRARLTPIDDYLKLCTSGRATISGYEFINITEEQRNNICKYWLEKINNRPYDYLSVIIIGLKIIWRDFKRLGKMCVPNKLLKSTSVITVIDEHSFYCTEGIQEAAASQGFDIWGMKYSTPVSTLEIKLEGKLVET